MSKVGIRLATLFLGSNAMLEVFDYFYIREAWSGQVGPKSTELCQEQRFELISARNTIHSNYCLVDQNRETLFIRKCRNICAYESE